MPLPPDLIPRARQIIMPLVGSDDEREALLTDAFYMIPDSRLYHLIKRDGNAMSFTTLCIKKLIDYGCLSGDMHALGQLLSAARLYCSVDKHAEIDRLVAMVNMLCVEPMLKTAPETFIPVPPSQGVQTIATPSSERRPTVFISYSHANDTFAQRLIVDLNAAGHTCWIDSSAIKGGSDWEHAICEGINLSYAVVVVCTYQALESDYVKDEIQWGRKRGKLIIPVLLEDVTGDDKFFGLHRFQGIRFDKLPYTEALAGLIAALPSAPEGLSNTTPRVISRRECELAYLNRLRFDDFRMEKFELAEYAPLGGEAQTRQRTLDSWGKLAMEQEFSLIRGTHRDEEQDSPPESFTDAVSKITELRRTVVLGEPGAGKTHTLRAIAKPLYTAALTDPKAPIPVMVKLGNWDGDVSFEVFLRAELSELSAYLDNLLADKRLVLLLDGLNEFPPDQRTKKYPQVESFIKKHPDVMAVVTCREADYPISLHLNKILIRPLDPLRIRDFATRVLRGRSEGEAFFWKLLGADARRFEGRFKMRFGDKLPDWEQVFWLKAALPESIEWKQEVVNTFYYSWELWRNLRDNPSGIMTLARNPYILRMLLDVYIQFGGVLPSNRGQLFAQFVNFLLKREKLAEIDSTTQTVTVSEEGGKLLIGLQRVAFEMQVQRANPTKDSSGAGTALTLNTVRDILDNRLLYLAVSTSIITSGNEVRFSHQLLQEYFAARYMDEEIKAGRLKATDIWKSEQWWERTNWEEAAILLAGLYSDDCSAIVEWVNTANPEVAAQCVVRSWASLADRTRERLTSEWLARLTDIHREPNPLARAAIGHALGLTGWDTRKGVGLGMDNLPEFDWVDIPAGEFLYGNDKKLLTLKKPFKISRYPVTYKQFQAFIDAPDGFHDPRWWEGLKATDDHKLAPGDQAFKFWNQPRERVNWYDAIAFCRWLSFKLTGKVYVLDEVDQWPMRLPTEFEWEKAARGTDGREYPYVGEFDVAKGNTRETGIGQTSAVGLFPNGASPDSVLDMSGNVWEWCLTLYGNPAPEAPSEDLHIVARRVLRGGSWYLNREFARASSREGFSPDLRYLDFGFRLVLLPPYQ